MANVTVEDISYNFDTFYSGEEVVDKALRNVEYKFTASGNGYKLEGKLTLPNELTREEAEQKIKGLLKE